MFIDFYSFPVLHNVSKRSNAFYLLSTDLHLDPLNFFLSSAFGIENKQE